MRAWILLPCFAALLLGCDRSEHRKEPVSKPALEPAVTAWIGASDRFAAILSPLAGSSQSPHWQDEKVRACLFGRADGKLPDNESFFSLRVYRIDRSTGSLPLTQLALAIVASAADGSAKEFVAHDLTLPPGDSPALTLLRRKSLAAFRGVGFESSSGFEAWVVIDAKVDFAGLKAARLTLGNETIELRFGSLTAERFSAIAARPSRDALVAAARSFDPQFSRKANAEAPSSAPRNGGADDPPH